MKELKDLAKGYRKLAAEAIYPGLPYSKYKRAPKSPLPENPSGQGSRAFASGNLLTQFISSPQNDINKIASKIGNGYQIVVNVAPKGAEYGRWVHYGTRKMIERPFAEIAADSDRFKQLLNGFMETESEKKVDGEIEKLDDMFNKAGFKVT
jgi:hypothetical protein